MRKLIFCSEKKIVFVDIGNQAMLDRYMHCVSLSMVEYDLSLLHITMGYLFFKHL